MLSIFASQTTDACSCLLLIVGLLRWSACREIIPGQGSAHQQQFLVPKHVAAVSFIGERLELWKIKLKSSFKFEIGWFFPAIYCFYPFVQGSLVLDYLGKYKMVSTEEVHFSDFAVKNAINPHITYAEKFRKVRRKMSWKWHLSTILALISHDRSTFCSTLQESEDIITDVGELASMLSAAGKQQELDTITKCVRELLDSSNDAKMYHEALNNLKTTYQATGEATDFHKFTKDFMQEYDDAAP